MPYDRRTWLEATTLRRAGYTVSVICPKAEGFEKSFETIDDIDIYRYSIPFEAKGVLSYLAEFAWCFVRSAVLSLRVQVFGRGFDAIHACNPPETLLASGACLAYAVARDFYLTIMTSHLKCMRLNIRNTAVFCIARYLWLEKMSFATAQTTIATNRIATRKSLVGGAECLRKMFLSCVQVPTRRAFEIVEPDLSLKRGRGFLCSYLGKMCEQDGVDYLVRAVKDFMHETGAELTFCSCSWVEGRRSRLLCVMSDELGD